MSGTRKLMLTLAGLVLGIALLAVGCAGEKTTPTVTPTKAPVATVTPTATPTAAPRATATPTQAVVATPTATSTSAPTQPATRSVLRLGRDIWNKNNPIEDPLRGAFPGLLAYDRLTIQTEDEGWVGQLAKSWELVNPTTWRFRLRDDVKFHDGTKLTAQDVKFTLDHIISTGQPASRSTKFLKEITVVDDYTVDLKNSQGDVFLPEAGGSLFIASKAHIEKIGGWPELTVQPMGSGPWKWTEWVPNDRTFSEKVPGGHPFRNVRIDRLEAYFVPGSETAIAALRTGSLDYIQPSLDVENVLDLQKRGFNVLNVGRNGYNSLGFSPQTACKLKWPTCDKRVRQAMNWAVDKESLAKNLFRGLVDPLREPASPAVAYYDPTVGIGYDPVKAEKLLDEAGFPRKADGTRFEIDWMSWIPGASQTMALAIVDMWAKVGIKANFERVDLTVFRLFYNRAEGRQPKHVMQIESSMTINWMFTGYCEEELKVACPYFYNNPDFITLRNQVYAEPDARKRDELMKAKFIKVMVEDPMDVWTVTNPRFEVYKTGIELGPKLYGGGPHFDNIYWKR